MSLQTNEKKILVISTQYPGCGEDATNAYALVKQLRKYNYVTCGLFYEFNTNVNYNPDNIEGIYIININDITKFNLKKIKEIQEKIKIFLGKEPDLIFCKNYTAPIFSK